MMGKDHFAEHGGADQRGRRISDAHQIDARVALDAGEGDRHFGGEGHQIVDEGRIVEEIHHQGAGSAQVNGQGAWTFDPALDDQISSDLLLEQSRSLDAVEHAPAAGGIGDRKSREHGLVREKRLVVDESGRHIVEEPDRRAEIAAFARGIGDAGNEIASEPLGRAYLSFHEHAIVRRVLKIFRPDLVGGEHHGDRHQRDTINRLPVEERKQSVTAVHRNVVLSNGRPRGVRELVISRPGVMIPPFRLAR